MKYYFFSIMFLGFAFAVTAQSNISPRYNYPQKRFLDSLRNANKQPAILINPMPQLVYNTPVIALPDDGEKWSLSGQDTIYKMKTDNMLLLKPNTNTARIPNAAEGKIFMIPPAEKKP